MSIRNLERIMDWGDKIGCTSLFVFIAAVIMAIIFAVSSLAYPTDPDVWMVATWFFYTAVSAFSTLIPTMAAIVYADWALKKLRPQPSYGVNWKRDGF